MASTPNVDRFCVAKQHTRAGGGISWGVYDTITKSFIEGGFFSKAAAVAAMREHNRTDPFGGNASNRPKE